MSFFRSVSPAAILDTRSGPMPAAEEKAHALVGDALNALEAGDLTAAGKAIDQADQLGCPIRDLAHVRALCLYASGEKTQAIKDAFRELNGFPDNAPVVELIGQMAAELGGPVAADFPLQWRTIPPVKSRLDRRLRVGMITPWNVRCGIEYYAKNIVRNVQHPDIEYVIFGREDDELTEPDTGNVRRCWDSILRHNETLDGLFEAIRAEKIDIVNFQVSYSFFYFPVLNVLFPRLQELGIKIFLSFHSTEPAEVRGLPVSVEMLKKSAQYVDRVLCYKAPDRDRLALVFGAEKVFLSNLPIAKFAATPRFLREERRKKLGIDRDFVVGTHGFILPNKGIEVVVEALGILSRRGISNVKFLSVTSVYERLELSGEVLKTCLEIADYFGIRDQVVMVDSYLEQKQIHQMLELCDLLAFCYTQSKETASGAVRQAIQTDVPIVTTPLSIFDDIAGFTRRMRDVTAEALADEIEAAMKQPERDANLLAARALYLQNHSTPVLVDDLEREMVGCLRDQITVGPEYPKISIVSPSFNCAKYIRACIEGVLAQDYPHFEHIIMDGASTDGTVEILKSYPHLRWISEPDSGEAEALNKALKLASGQLINWLNVDDTYFDRGVLHHVAGVWSENQDAGVIYGKGIVVNDAGELVMYRTPILPPVTVGALMRWYTNLNLFQPAMFYSDRLVRDVGFFREDLFFSIDLEYWLRIAAKGYRFEYTDRILANATLVRDGAKSGNSVETQHKNWQEIVAPFQDCLTRPERLNYWRDFYLYRIRNPLKYVEPVTLPDSADTLIGMVMAYLELFDVQNASAALTKLAKNFPSSPELYWLVAEVQHRVGQGGESRRAIEIGKEIQSQVDLGMGDNMLNP